MLCLVESAHDAADERLGKIHGDDSVEHTKARNKNDVYDENQKGGQGP